MERKQDWNEERIWYKDLLYGTCRMPDSFMDNMIMCSRCSICPYASQENRCTVGGIVEVVITNKYWTDWLCPTLHTHPLLLSKLIKFLSTTLVYPTYLPTWPSLPYFKFNYSSLYRTHRCTRALNIGGANNSLNTWPCKNLSLTRSYIPGSTWFT